MGCFTLGWLQQLFVYVIIVGAIIALIRLLLPIVFANLGAPGGVIQRAIEIILWAFVAILCVYLIFGLISCLAGGSFSLLPPHR